MCKNLEPVLSFLSEGFGVEILRRRTMMTDPPTPVADVNIGGAMYILKQVGPEWQDPDPAALICGYHHLGFLVDDLDACLARLTARPDTRLVVEPYSVGKRLCAFVAGPDNLYVEVMQDT